MVRMRVILLVLFTVVGRAENENGRVLELTDATIDAAIAKHDYIFVDFYAPWCFHCKKFSPELDAAAPVLGAKVPPILLAKLNADKYSKVASRFDVRGYPTLKFFIKGYPVDYNGPRKAVSLASHLQKLRSPDVEVIQNETELHNFLQNTDDNFPFFIGFGVDSTILIDFAKEYKNKAWFLVLANFSEKIMESFDFDRSPALVALRRSQREQEIFYSPLEGDDLTLFIKQNVLPRVNPLTSENLRTLREDGRPIALAVLNDDSSEQSQSFIKKLRAAAPANRGFIFAYVDTLQWPSFADSLHKDVKTKMLAFIIWNGDSTYFVSAEGYDFTGERAEVYITLFLQQYKEGKAKKLNMKGPSFTDFIWSLISMRSVYILVLIAALIFFAQNMLASDSGDVGRRQVEEEEIKRGLDKHRGLSRHSGSESSFDGPRDTAKDD